MTGQNRNIRDFILNGFALQKQIDLIDEIERNELEHPFSSVEEIIEPFLDDFQDYKRRRASQMARYYEIMYLLEDKLRALIIDALIEGDTDDWWVKKVPKHIQDEAARLQQKEIDLGITLRSRRPIDFTTFGQLADIVSENKEAMTSQFLSVSGLQRILAVINNLRGPIAHNTVLGPDEVARLYVAVRDFFRLIRKNLESA